MKKQLTRKQIKKIIFDVLDSINDPAKLSLIARKNRENLFEKDFNKHNINLRFIIYEGRENKTNIHFCFYNLCSKKWINFYYVDNKITILKWTKKGFLERKKQQKENFYNYLLSASIKKEDKNFIHDSLIQMSNSLSVQKDNKLLRSDITEIKRIIM